MNLDNLVSQLKAERDRFTRAIAALEHISSSDLHRSLRVGAPSLTKRGRRRMSAAARRRISLAQKARWARQSGQRTGSNANKPKRRSRMTAAGRKKLSQIMKARWAAKKKVSKTK